jgi:hypothetical protein
MQSIQNKHHFLSHTKLTPVQFTLNVTPQYIAMSISVHAVQLIYIPLLTSHSLSYNSRNKRETIPATIDGRQIGDGMKPKKQSQKVQQSHLPSSNCTSDNGQLKRLLCSNQECSVLLRADQIACSGQFTGSYGNDVIFKRLTDRDG